MASNGEIGLSTLNSNLANLGAESPCMLDSKAGSLPLDIFCPQHHLWSPCCRKPPRAARFGYAYDSVSARPVDKVNGCSKNQSIFNLEVTENPGL